MIGQIFYGPEAFIYIDNFNYWLLSVCEETFNQYNKKMFMKNLH